MYIYPMQILYNFLIYVAAFCVKVAAIFNSKLRLFVSGRKETLGKLSSEISKSDKVFWIHCASLGEFEQGRPVIEKFKQEHPDYKIVLTFFSPSGYEVQKKYDLANVVVNLPIDTPENAKKFVNLLNPKIAVFVKYEIWPNMLKELKNKNIPTLLVSGIFRKEQIYFKNYGVWMRSKLASFTHFFLQDADSASLLQQVGFTNITVCGDTRFDRVYDILSRDNELDFINDFVQNNYVTVAGSTWPEDEELLVDYIKNKAASNEKFIIAPHNIKEEGVTRLRNQLGDLAVLYSEREGKDLSSFQVFVADTIGILTKIYSKAHVAYVGGGYTKSGIHNILEPATFGIPVVIGPNYKKFREAKDLVRIGGCITTSDQKAVDAILTEFRDNDVLRNERGALALNYIKKSLGASEKICQFIDSTIK
ncbi:3-deoxy-D-manno-octulosonic acid transferase [Flavicella marina]|uniref:3-deoxy-D-manno-octulosonic acid transferase n=1 Tax=Flavicella marina TaxID=1475951 RepID=UPI001D02425C|nr:glycosyltransferase N-terminal domain-containing protein [Flavicella marina]